MKTSFNFGNGMWLSVKHKRRGISEVISTVLLVAITVVGAVMVSSYFQNTHVMNLATQFSSNSLQPQISASLQLTGYDTRDGIGLSGINSTKTTTSLDNFYDSKLCTNSCAGINNAYANNIPQYTPSAQKGTDFIVLKIKNVGIGTVSIKDVTINDVDHLWASQLSGNLKISSSSGIYPNAGKFVIIPATNGNLANGNQIQLITTNQLQNGVEVRLVIKLSPSLVVNSLDPPLNTPLKVRIYTDNPNAPTFTILSGDIM